VIKLNYQDGETYTAEQLMAPWQALLNDGVYNVSGGAFLVSAHSPADLSVNVVMGKATKNGMFINSDSNENVLIEANTSGYNRIDIVVVDISTATIKAVKGTGSSSPTPPLPTSTQLVIAQILVGNNVSVINTGNITDKRISAINTALLENNGWIRDAQTGLITQWGVVDIAVVDGVGTQVITFPIPFPNDIFVAIPTVSALDGGESFIEGINCAMIANTTSATIKVKNLINTFGTYYSVNWFAKGK